MHSKIDLCDNYLDVYRFLLGEQCLVNPSCRGFYVAMVSCVITPILRALYRVMVLRFYAAAWTIRAFGGAACTSFCF